MFKAIDDQTIPRGVIFDVDGTLVDSVDLHAKAWQQTFQHFGHTVELDAIRAQIGKGGDQLMPVFLPNEQVDLSGEEIQQYRADLFKREFVQQVKPFPQVRDLFQRLLKDGWKIALASSAKGEELKTYKEIANISDLLDTEASSDDASASKPEPDIFNAAMNHLPGLSPQDCVVVGDSPYDAEAATKAGIPAVGLLCGGFPEERLRKSGFLVLYKDPADLLAQYEHSLFGQQQLESQMKTKAGQ